jgi:adenine phosphoribosyltransferase
MTMNKKKQGCLRDYIRSIPDFPKKGILFHDITTLISHPWALRKSISDLTKVYKGVKIDKVVAVEARGFVFGAALAYKLGVGLVLVRKKGKLPFKTVSASYSLEYGVNELEMHADAVNKGEKVVIVDDLLATGGTIEAVIRLLDKFKAKIQGIACVIELPDLKGREKLKKYPVTSLVKIEGA